MPASIADLSRLGQVNAANDALALFLKVFGGEVLTAFHEAQVTSDKHMTKTITHGKSAQFPVTGTATAKYMTPGLNILDTTNGLLSKVKHNEKVINIDDLLIASTSVAQIDELMNHYETRSIYSAELGQALAEQWDQHVLQTILLAAETATPNITGSGLTGTVLKEGKTVATNSGTLAKAIYKAVAQLRKNKNPKTLPIYAYLRPDEYYMLVQDEKVLDKQLGGDGSFSAGTARRIAGAILVETQNLPSTDVASSGTTEQKGPSDKYAGDFSNTVALVATPRAAGTVKLLDLAMETKWFIEYQTNLIVAKYAVGHGILRPECAVEISQAST